jgi:adenosylmethionine-8-amino-7-oxononanoate aminotransferase
MLRASADTICLSPPLIVSEAEIGEIVARTRKAFDQVA